MLSNREDGQLQGSAVTAPIITSFAKAFQVLSLSIVGLSFFSNLRIGTLTAFDVGAAAYCAAVLPVAAHRFERKFLIDHLAPLAAFLLFVLAALTSAIVAYDTSEHIYRSLILAADSLLMIGFSYLAIRQVGLDFVAIQQALVLSSAITGAVCIAQGKFGLFLGLLQEQRLEFWTRPTGLTEHPVEAGIVVAYGCLFSVALILDRRRILLNTICLFVIAYSGTVSASLTAAISSLGCILIFLVIRGSLRLTSVVLVFLLFASFLFLFADTLSNTFFAERLSQLSRSGLEYGTLTTRTSQMAETISLLLESGPNFLVGFGYDPDALINGIDIHNGLLAAWYHFGLLGLASQILFILYFLSACLRKDRNERAVSMLIFSIFILFYLSGPAFFRRSVWLPMFLIAETSLRDQRRRMIPLRPVSRRFLTRDSIRLQNRG